MKHRHGVSLLSISLAFLTLPLLPSATALTLPTLSNQTIPLSLQIPTNFSTTPPNGPIRHCVADPTWSKSHHNIAPSCESALLALTDDKQNYGSSPGIFTFSNGRSWAKFPDIGKSLTLPKRYQSKQCVVAVVMVKMFENAGLHFPELSDGKSWPYVDEVMWEDFIEPASYVRATCGNGVGYAVVGREMGVAVVILESESKWDRYIQGLRGAEGEGDVDGYVAGA